MDERTPVTISIAIARRLNIVRRHASLPMTSHSQIAHSQRHASEEIYDYCPHSSESSHANSTASLGDQSSADLLGLLIIQLCNRMKIGMKITWIKQTAVSKKHH